jgi:hypothetical protein
MIVFCGFLILLSLAVGAVSLICLFSRRLRRRAQIALGLSLVAFIVAVAMIPVDKSSQVTAAATASPTTPIVLANAAEPVASPPADVAADADKDATPVAQCDGLPPSVSIMVISWSETTKICRAMVRVLEGVRHKDITTFEKAAYLLHAKGGYEKDNVQVTQELVEIIRLRGLYDKPDRWYGTLDLILRAWEAFHGVVGPTQVISFLRSAGPDAAKGLSDDGLTSMIILMKRQYQSGE